MINLLSTNMLSVSTLAVKRLKLSLANPESEDFKLPLPNQVFYNLKNELDFLRVGSFFIEAKSKIEKLA